MKLTDMLLRNLKPQSKRYIVWADNGLGVRVSPKGRRTFVFMYRHEGKARFLSLGEYPKMTVASAHKAHGEAMKNLEQGIDPGAVTVAERKEDRKSPTVADLAQEYLEKWAKPRKRSWAVDRRILHKDVVPQWGRRKAKDITRRDVIQLLDKVAERGGIMSNRTLSVIKKMYNFGLNRDLVPISPCIGVQALAPENRRDRVLSAGEIKTFWQGLEQTRISPNIRLALKIILACGQRKGEVIGAQWSDVNLNESSWVIPETKNGVIHQVPLSSLVVELFEAAKTLSPDSSSPWVFPSLKRNGPIAGASVDHSLRLALNSIEVDHFTPHDLRRTAATSMASMGVASSIISRVLNHKDQTVTGLHYNHYDYAKEKRLALESWARRLRSIIEGAEISNVISIIREA